MLENSKSKTLYPETLEAYVILHPYISLHFPISPASATPVLNLAFQEGDLHKADTFAGKFVAEAFKIT